MQWTSDDQRGRQHPKQLHISIWLLLALITTAADMAKAQANSMQKIAVTCVGSENVATDTLTILCTDLHNALTAHYPDASFVLAGSVAGNAAGLLTLETFAANKMGIEARLIWQASDADRVEGPQMGFSISDTDMTPDMQHQFLNRLVHATPLPF